MAVGCCYNFWLFCFCGLGVVGLVAYWFGGVVLVGLLLLVVVADLIFLWVSGCVAEWFWLIDYCL